MKGIIRHYTKADVPDMVRHSEEAKILQESQYKGIKFDKGKVSDMLYAGLGRAAFFCDVLDVNNEIGGALCATVFEYMHSREAFAQDLIFYIRPEYRDATGAVALLRNYIAWGKSRKVRQIRFDQTTGYKMDKFGVLMKRAGFSQIGTKWSMEG